MKITLLLSLTLSIISSSDKRYIYVGGSGNRYDQSEAQSICETDYNGDLASIYSAEENQRVVDLCNDFGKLQGGCLIGLTNRFGALPTTWMNGQTVSYTNWASGEPDRTGNQPYVIIKEQSYVNGIAGEWETVLDIKYPFICEQVTETITLSTGATCESFGEQLLPGPGDDNTMILTANQCLQSNNGQYVTIMQSDGNLVTYDAINGGSAIWYSDAIIDPDGQFLVLQETDCNLVIYNTGDNAGTARWALSDYIDIGTCTPSHLVLQDDGNLVLYESNGDVLWDSFGEWVVTFGTLNVKYQVKGSSLLPDEILNVGEALKSDNGLFAAIMVNTGNLMVIDLQRNLWIWDSNVLQATLPNDPYFVLQGSDGNGVIYTAQKVVLFATYGYCDPAVLVMQGDGNLVVYDVNGDAKWDSLGHAGITSGVKGNAMMGLFNFDGGIIVGSDGDGVEIGVYMVWLIVVLMILNCVCVGISCWNRRKRDEYKVVSMNSSDTDVV